MDEHERVRGALAAPAPAARADAGAPAPLLAVSGLERRFGKVAALAGIDLAVQPGELVTLLGPSGAGKTTLLKVVAGSTRPDQGHVMLAGRDVTVLPPARRGIGMVFHDRSAFRHSSPAASVGFPFGRHRLARVATRPEEVSAFALVGLSGYERRNPRRLSSSQQLRAALAHAIMFDPALLLIDECFAALDRPLRARMQTEVRNLQRRLGLATLFATQDREAALLVSDRIAAMREGRIVQISTPEELHRRPASRFVAELLGEANFFRGRGGVISGDTVEVKLESGGTMRATLPLGDRAVHYGADLALVLRPDRPRRLAPAEPAENRVAGTVSEMVYLGEIVRYRVALADGGEIVLRWPASQERLRPGMPVELGWPASDMTAVLWS